MRSVLFHFILAIGLPFTSPAAELPDSVRNTLDLSSVEAEKEDTLSRMLSELVVEAKKEIHTSDADIIYLSKKNREFGTNALDAISSLRQFSPVIDGTSLTNATMQQVAIVINGRPSTAQDLRGYTGNEIRKVTYYPVAPPRYSDVTDGPLVEVEVKVNKDFISAFLSASNSLNVGYGTDQAVIRWADSLNLVRADYFIDYRNLRYDNSELYSYPASPMLNRSYSTSSHYTGHSQYGKISWQNTAHGNVFYLSAMFSNNPGTRTFDNKDAEGDDAYDYTRWLRSLSNVGSLNMFFRTKVGKGRIDLQANGSLGRTESDNILERISGSQSGTAFHNNTSRVYGKLLYYMPIRKVNFFASGSYRYQHTVRKQSLPVADQYDTDYHNLYLSTSISGSVSGHGRRLSYSLGLGVDYQGMSSPHRDLSLDHWNFTPYLTLGASLSKRLFVRLRGSIASGFPTVGQLSEELTYQDSNLAWGGNPDLKGWTTYSLTLQPELWVIPKFFTINGDLSFKYRNDPVMQCVEAGSPVVIRSVNVADSKDADAVVYFNVTPCSWLTVKPYIQWSYTTFETLDRDISRGYLRYGGSVTCNSGRFQGVASVNAPYKQYSGDICEYGGWQLSVTALYKLPKSVTVSLGWRRSYQDDRTDIYGAQVLHYISRQRIPRLANQITLGLTWNFSHGLFKKRVQPQVGDDNSDSGLMDYNKAKM